VSVGVMLVLWSLLYDYTTFLPSPGEVLEEARSMFGNTDVFAPILGSLWRLLLGLVIGFVAGLMLALQSTRGVFLAQVTNTYVRIALTVPSLLVALLGLVIFGISDWAAVLTVAVIVFPFAAVPMIEGVKSLDPELQKMGHVYRMSRMSVIRHVVLPHMAPFLFSAIRNSHALGWKVLIVAEIFSVQSGIGQQFNRAFSLFDLPRVIVWLVIFLLIIGFIEYGVLAVFERRVFRWRSNRNGRRTVAVGV
jgi:NitT/TauT family transport system permease protein